MLYCVWKVLPHTTKGDWKKWKQSKIVWNCRNQIFQFNIIQNIWKGWYFDGFIFQDPETPF